jgi:hypothetical protein
MCRGSIFAGGRIDEILKEVKKLREEICNDPAMVDFQKYGNKDMSLLDIEDLENILRDHQSDCENTNLEKYEKITKFLDILELEKDIYDNMSELDSDLYKKLLSELIEPEWLSAEIKKWKKSPNIETLVTIVSKYHNNKLPIIFFNSGDGSKSQSISSASDLNKTVITIEPANVRENVTPDFESIGELVSDNENIVNNNILIVDCTSEISENIDKNNELECLESNSIITIEPNSSHLRQSNCVDGCFNFLRHSYKLRAAVDDINNDIIFKWFVR